MLKAKRAEKDMVPIAFTMTPPLLSGITVLRNDTGGTIDKPMLKERKNIQFPRNTNRPKSAPIGQCASQCVFACHSNPLECLVLLNGIRLASRDDDNWDKESPIEQFRNDFGG